MDKQLLESYVVAPASYNKTYSWLSEVQICSPRPRTPVPPQPAHMAIHLRPGMVVSHSSLWARVGVAEAEATSFSPEVLNCSLCLGSRSRKTLADVRNILTPVLRWLPSLVTSIPEEEIIFINILNTNIDTQSQYLKVEVEKVRINQQKSKSSFNVW